MIPEMPTSEDPYREPPASLPSTRTPLVDRLLAWFEVHHETVAPAVLLTALFAFLITAPIAFAIVVTIGGGVAAFCAAIVYVIDKDYRAHTLLVGLCSLAVAVLSASALYLFAPDSAPVTEDECECCVSAEEAKP